MFDETFRRYIGRNETPIATGRTVIGTSADRKWKRKMTMTNATTIISSIRVAGSVATARRISSVRS